MDGLVSGRGIFNPGKILCQQRHSNGKNGQAGQCMVSVHGILGWASWAVHGAWWRCMAVHAALCMGDVSNVGWVKASVYFLVGKMHVCTTWIGDVGLGGWEWSGC